MKKLKDYKSPKFKSVLPDAVSEVKRITLTRSPNAEGQYKCMILSDVYINKESCEADGEAIDNLTDNVLLTKAEQDKILAIIHPKL